MIWSFFFFFTANEPLEVPPQKILAQETALEGPVLN